MIPEHSRISGIPSLKRKRSADAGPAFLRLRYRLVASVLEDRAR